MRVSPISFYNFKQSKHHLKFKASFDNSSNEAVNYNPLNSFYISGILEGFQKSPLKEAEFDELILKFEDKIKNYKKEGIPLQYPKKDYLKDLNNLLKSLPSDKRQEIIKKLAIVPYMSDCEIISWEGFLTLENLDLKNETEKRVFNITDRFLNKNKANTEKYNLNKIINSIIIAFPEFINIIGKKQSEGQRYSVDIHTLMVLLNCIKNEQYNTLTPEEKAILKTTVIFHDTAKLEGVVDSHHAVKSAAYYLDASRRLKIPEDLKIRTYNQIKNHHWLEKLNNGIITPYDVKSVFKTQDEFKIAKIITKADITGIGNPKYLCFLDEFKGAKVKAVEELFSNPSKHSN